MTPEQKFYQWFRQQLPNSVDCVRVENTLEGGTPDVNVCQGLKHFWIEMKVFMNDRCLIRPDQYAWGNRRAAVNGKVVILCRSNSGHVWAWQFPDVTVIPHGKYLHVVNGARVFNDGKSLVNFLFT